MLIWVSILNRNAGISFNYILNKLERSRDEWFIDASTSWGIGGCSGTRYFIYPHEKLHDLYTIFYSSHNHERFNAPLPIAYIELLAVVVALSAFSSFSPNMLITLNSDNTDVVAWLRKGRCSSGTGFKLLGAIEYFKRRHHLKFPPAIYQGGTTHLQISYPVDRCPLG